MSADRATSWARAVFTVAAAAGLGASILLLYEYVSPAAQLCGPGGGCDAVRNSTYASLLGVPTPALGVAYFTLALVALTWGRARRWLLPLAAVGAVAGVVFIALQAFEIGAWCTFCLVVDVASIALLPAALAIAREGAERALPLGFAAPAGLLGAAVPVLVGVALASGGGDLGTGPVPDVIVGEQRPGIATIVEFLDFECPYCREQHVRMKPLLEEYGERVRIVYKHVPLSGHRNARGAARAWCCGDEQGRGIELADALLTAEDLTPDGCARAAERLGVDMEQYAECIESDRPDHRLAGDREAAEAVGLRGLPTFYVGRQRMEGLKETSVVREAIERALASN